MNITVTDADRNMIIQKQAIQIADKDLTIATLTRMITEMELAAASDEKDPVKKVKN